MFSSAKQQTATTSSTTLSISGSIRPSAGGAGATVVLSGASTAMSTTTDSSGNYRFDGLASGSYTVTPEKSNVQFTPSRQSATLSAQAVTGLNFKATTSNPQTFSVSGTISPAASGAGTTVRLSGPATATTVADSSGNFQFIGLTNGTYTLTPSSYNLTFTPTVRTATVDASNVTRLNFTVTQNVTVSTSYSLSGTISPSGIGAGTTVTLSGAANATSVADSSGNFFFSGLASGNYTLTPSKASFTFSPASQITTIRAADASGVNFTIAQSSTNIVSIYPGQDIPNLVAASPAGTTFLIYPGSYRLAQPITPKDGDSFIGQTACAPPASSCAAIIKGSRIIGPLASFDGMNYKVMGQTQHNPTGTTSTNCDAGWLACIHPEDLFFDGVPYRHLDSPSLPSIGPGQWWFDYTNHIIYFHDNPAGHTVETSVLPYAFGGAANNITIQYLTVEEFADMYPNGTIGVFQGSNPQTHGANWTVENCEVLLNHGYGVRVAYGVRILNNYIHDNGQSGVGGGIGVRTAPLTESLDSHIVIQGNTINHNDYAHFNPDFGSGGIKIGATSGVTIRGNTIRYNEGAGIHFDDYSQNELVDGNVISDNTDSDGLIMEIGYGTSTVRNNVVLRNGKPVNDNYFTDQIAVHASAGVNAYCNVLEISPGKGVNGWIIGAANRGFSSFPPFQYLATTGNTFHHNTVIWDAGAGGGVGFVQDDAAHQPNFFANNAPSDYNTYHLPSTSDQYFIYDNNNTQNNTPVTFARYQSAGADVHGTADTNYTSGFPAVTIASPADQSPVTSPVTVTATASDASGISKVDFYVDWVLQATVESSPYSYSWTNATSGSHTITVMAYSNAGIRACSAVTLNAQ
jgi:parallel beta-helix repeat protein